MTLLPIDPSFSVSGAEWQVQPLQGSTAAPGASEGFSNALGKAVGSLQASQTEAADASQALAAGTATDQTAAVMSLERARLSMQLASQVRTKAVDSFTEIMRTSL